MSIRLTPNTNQNSTLGNKMTIERQNNEIIIRIPDSLGVDEIQRMINYIRYSEITAKSKAKQEEINKIADDVDRSWWEKNKERLL